jgi:hypothetical protein
MNARHILKRETYLMMTRCGDVANATREFLADAIHLDAV